MDVKSYLSPKIKIGQSKVQGLGLFAVENIKKDEIIGIKAGYIINRETLERIGGLKSDIGQSMLQVSDEFFIGPLTADDIGDSMMYVNHSCEPNIGMLGDVINVAMRDIVIGEELTADYAVALIHPSLLMECNCGAINCRKIITGEDWKRPELQGRYKGYFSAYIQKKIKEEK
ncbi:MAG: SET domain-containing protein-lysine N-methyltransferase [Candidatus Portnoybacteria bacterium]|nr:SET domain-containing protein-lysine N-methyltransferase [Candidatus Portnoybacteria bacterium]